MDLNIFWSSVGYILLAEILCLPFSYLLSKLVNLDEEETKAAPRTMQERDFAKITSTQKILKVVEENMNL